MLVESPCTPVLEQFSGDLDFSYAEHAEQDLRQFGMQRIHARELSTYWGSKHEDHKQITFSFQPNCFV
jgi:hypothetical protein